MIEIEGKCDLCLIVEYENHSNKSKTSLAYQIRYFLVENRRFELGIWPFANRNKNCNTVVVKTVCFDRNFKTVTLRPCLNKGQYTLKNVG